jgi:hypothetical protein
MSPPIQTFWLFPPNGGCAGQSFRRQAKFRLGHERVDLKDNVMKIRHIWYISEYVPILTLREAVVQDHHQLRSTQGLAPGLLCLGVGEDAGYVT